MVRLTVGINFHVGAFSASLGPAAFALTGEWYPEARWTRATCFETTCHARRQSFTSAGFPTQGAGALVAHEDRHRMRRCAAWSRQAAEGGTGCPLLTCFEGEPCRPNHWEDGLSHVKVP